MALGRGDRATATEECMTWVNGSDVSARSRQRLLESFNAYEYGSIYIYTYVYMDRVTNWLTLIAGRQRSRIRHMS